MTLPLLMGIINTTPDSFSDGGALVDVHAAIEHGMRLMDEGATILDVGGESTRPGATPTTAEEEQRRVLPVIKGLAAEVEKRGVKISVDTRNASTMKAALQAGASIINDISALTHDPRSLGVAASSHAELILMHMLGTPQTMQHAPHYDDAVGEVYAYLEQRIAACEQAGITKARLIADIGLGFGKTPAHNLALLQHLPRFRHLGVRLLVGASRKSFIAALAQDQSTPQQRLGGSLAAALYAAQQGADMLRVHDVGETRQMLTVWKKIVNREQ